MCEGQKQSSMTGLLATGFLLVGPVPGLGLKSSYELCVVSVIVAGKHSISVYFV